MDELTTLIILRLQLQDIEELIAGDKGKQREGQVSDRACAIALYKGEVERATTLLTDRQLGRSIARAVQEDAQIITDLVEAEAGARRDRILARRMGGMRDSEEAEQGPPPTADDDTCERFSSLNKEDATYSVFTGDHDTTPTDMTSVASTEETDRPAILCIVCQEYRAQTETLEAPCQHNYCRDCLSELFEASTEGESLFPPRCCRKDIPLEFALSLLSGELVSLFEKKSVEFSSTNRTYCAGIECSEFIPPGQIINNVGACSACQSKTCTLCKGNEHKNEDCPDDPETRRFHDFAQENEWQRCFSCKRMVELNIGCNHIT